MFTLKGRGSRLLAPAPEQRDEVASLQNIPMTVIHKVTKQ